MIVATSGAQKVLLQGEFPRLTFVDLTGYNVKYGKNRALTLLKIITSIPEILIRIKHENNWLREFLDRNSVDAVIADNRYGLYDIRVFSVFMTHQLLIKSAAGSWADRLLQRINYRAINRFSLCWVPDLAEDPEKDGNNEHALAGELSHPEIMPHIPTRYIGLLSRFEPCDGTVEAGGVRGAEAGEVSTGIPGAGGMRGAGPATTERPLLILLSGPEPQRTIFEKKILEQMGSHTGKVTLVRGLPGAGLQEAAVRADASPAGIATSPSAQVISAPSPAAAITSYDHLPSAALNRVICEAGLVISRPGYSSIMDLLKLGKKCIFVPTPGQTEQEYLGDHLAARGLAVCMTQQKFSLADALAAAKTFPFKDAGIGTGQTDAATPSPAVPPSSTILQKEISAFLDMVMARRKERPA